MKDSVELRFYELFDIVTKRFDSVEDALLFYRKNREPYHKNGKGNKNHKYKVSWVGGEYRFLNGGEWSEWMKI